MEHSFNLNTVVGVILGGLIAMVGFLIKKWTGGLEKKVDTLGETKMDVKLCEVTHKALCQKFDSFKETLDEVRRDVKEITKSISAIEKRGV